MRAFSPRIWAFSDYSKEITDHVPPQTKKEKQLAIVLSIPFFLFGISFPFISTLLLKGFYGGTIPLLDAFLNAFGVLLLGFLADFVILDYLIVGTITPKFVIIPGTEHMKNKEYKDFRLYHAKGHIKGLPLLAIVSLVIAVIVVFL